MIELYTCPVCKGVQRILVNTETSKHASHIRCAYNGCKSYHSLFLICDSYEKT